MDIVGFQDEMAPEWDGFAAAACNATLLHTRRFISYHGDRFRDRSLLFRDRGRLVGLLPAAGCQDDPSVVTSHPGMTYGGVVHQGALRGGRMLEALALAAEHYRRLGYRKLRYKAVPHIYQTTPAQDDLYALFRLGARRYRCDLSSCIDLSARLPLSERRQRSLRKARRHELEIRVGRELACDLWPVLEDNLRRKHQARPVHSFEEIALLADRFPREIEFIVAYFERTAVAGVVLFMTASTAHAQYIAASETGYRIAALDAVFEFALARVAAGRVRFFDFGTCNECCGLVLNEGLYRFKTGFGGGGVVYESYELELRGA